MTRPCVAGEQSEDPNREMLATNKGKTANENPELDGHRIVNADQSVRKSNKRGDSHGGSLPHRIKHRIRGTMVTEDPPRAPTNYTCTPKDNSEGAKRTVAAERQRRKTSGSNREPILPIPIARSSKMTRTRPGKQNLRLTSRTRKYSINIQEL